MYVGNKLYFSTIFLHIASYVAIVDVHVITCTTSKKREDYKYKLHHAM